MSRWREWIRFGLNPWANGLRVALLNVVLAGLSVGLFAGSLAVVSGINLLLRRGGSTGSGEFPFPYPVPLVLGAVGCVMVWVWIGHRLPGGGRARLLSSLVGAAPMFGISVAGYLGAVALLIGNELDPQGMAAPPVFVLAIFATLMLMAGMACALLLLRGGNPVHRESRVPSGQQGPAKKE